MESTITTGLRRDKTARISSPVSPSGVAVMCFSPGVSSSHTTVRGRMCPPAAACRTAVEETGSSICQSPSTSRTASSMLRLLPTAEPPVTTTKPPCRLAECSLACSSLSCSRGTYGGSGAVNSAAICTRTSCGEHAETGTTRHRLPSMGGLSREAASPVILSRSTNTTPSAATGTAATVAQPTHTLKAVVLWRARNAPTATTTPTAATAKATKPHPAARIHRRTRPPSTKTGPYPRDPRRQAASLSAGARRYERRRDSPGTGPSA